MKRRSKIKRPSVYWVYTSDHYEDWFVVARSSRAARDFHENDCGYDVGDARAKLVCELQGETSASLPTYVGYKDLARCGVRIVHKDYPTVFEKDGMRYKEGAIVEDIYTAATDNISGLYVLQMRDTNYFKIGVTTHLRNRICSLTTANPVRFAVTCFVEVRHPSKLESKLHHEFRKKRQEGEWFRLSDRDLRRLHHVLSDDVQACGGRFHLNRFD